MNECICEYCGVTLFYNTEFETKEERKYDHIFGCRNTLKRQQEILQAENKRMREFIKNLADTGCVCTADPCKETDSYCCMQCKAKFLLESES